AMRLFAGRVVGSQRANIGFEFPAVVSKLHVENGQKVAMGEVLAELDTRALLIEQVELKAAKRELQARNDQLSKELARFTSLREEGYVSEGELDAIRTQHQSNQEQLAQMRSKLRGVGLRLQKAQLKAPFDGEIANIQIEEGVVVGAGQAVLQLVQTARIEAIFGVADRLGQDLVVGQELAVMGDFGEGLARLLSVSQNLDWHTQTRTIRTAIPESIPVVDGNVIYLMLKEQRNMRGSWLPTSALIEDVRGNWAVYSLATDEGGMFLRKRAIKIAYQYRDQVFVKSDLDQGEQVIVSGTQRLASRQYVKLAQKEVANEQAAK
ncbi:MAG: efflux RND transporter periplasmic adaptor subunit, partial [Spongiibacteraceae bacterium]